MNEHPGVFREDGEIMFCNFCDLSIEWKSKSTVDGHCLSKGHIKKKQVYESNEQTKKQLTISTVNAAFESKKEVIKDLIEAFSHANIPLEKVNHLLPFFKSILKKEVQFLRLLYFIKYIYHAFLINILLHFKHILTKNL